MSIGNRVIIIGAGISGLSLAALLVRSGVAVTVLEKSNKIGGRTASMLFRNHILDNGFHIMPFYKSSAIYKVLQILGLTTRLRIAKVQEIAFYSGSRFYRYPKGLIDLLGLSLIPFKNRIRLLRILIPMAFRRMEDLSVLKG